MARRVMKVTDFEGRSLETIHAELAQHLTEAPTPPRIDDAMTVLGYRDPFARDMIKRSFMVTLKPGGSNEHLTSSRKWLKGREKWADEVESGKVTLAFEKVTAPTQQLVEKVEKLNGEMTDEARGAVTSIASHLAMRANAKLDATTIAYITEDVSTLVTENVALGRENAVHERYRKAQEEQMSMMRLLVAKVTGNSDPGAVKT